MDEDVLRAIRNHLERIADLHTAGIPGRNDTDGTQEIDYAAMSRAIMNSG